MGTQWIHKDVLQTKKLGKGGRVGVRFEYCHWETSEGFASQKALCHPHSTPMRHSRLFDTLAELTALGRSQNFIPGRLGLLVSTRLKKQNFGFGQAGNPAYPQFHWSYFNGPQKPRWPWILAASQLEPKTLIYGLNRGQYVVQNDLPEFSCLINSIQLNLEFCHPKQLWRVCVISLPISISLSLWKVCSTAVRLQVAFFTQKQLVGNKCLEWNCGDGFWGFGNAAVVPHQTSWSLRGLGQSIEPSLWTR